MATLVPAHRPHARERRLDEQAADGASDAGWKDHQDFPVD
jgi:hypothetical protein